MRAIAYAVIASVVACGGTTNPGPDASSDASSASDVAADASLADASCGPVDPNVCACSQPMPECCAELDVEAPSCTLSSFGATCLPSCSTEAFQCSTTTTTINVIRPICYTSSDCASHVGYECCSTIACQPNRVSVCLSADEAQTRGLSCL